ncbi:MAG TPA: hypothetical protein PKO34_03505 [Smithellaceae bacterium]|nr:hypothetical protein [Smithellaceae bacterium]
MSTACNACRKMRGRPIFIDQPIMLLKILLSRVDAIRNYYSFPSGYEKIIFLYVEHAIYAGAVGKAAYFMHANLSIKLGHYLAIKFAAIK